MKIHTCLLLLLALATGACKKHKDEPPIPVSPTYAMLQSYIANGDNYIKPVWYTKEGKEEYRSMKEIVNDNTLETKVFFGRYQNGVNDGLYAPAAYPVKYGQQNWKIQNKTIFRKPAFTEKEFAVVIDNEHETVTTSFIDQAYNNSTVIGDKVTSFSKGNVFIFETQDGKTRGIIQVVGYWNNGQVLTLEMWSK